MALDTHKGTLAACLESSLWNSNTLNQPDPNKGFSHGFVSEEKCLDFQDRLVNLLLADKSIKA